ncbi:hypothetical protein TRFO_30200 [Tritrichomonas foetus]|uniref:Uncharacterized protein n=1 Tax=Tritrichomonas foetus TaxID=1144522 RepID=A0A1J4JYP8_9EUKA|nr:hypothetical protein TRFO_30200 [Tritrichomonas foetus]|eukprot:OHT02660.1 hypothetical protein TRFO_30200 [Tritrichomonas foetus]
MNRRNEKDTMSFGTASKTISGRITLDSSDSDDNEEVESQAEKNEKPIIGGWAKKAGPAKIAPISFNEIQKAEQTKKDPEPAPQPQPTSPASSPVSGNSMGDRPLRPQRQQPNPRTDYYYDDEDDDPYNQGGYSNNYGGRGRQNYNRSRIPDDPYADYYGEDEYMPKSQSSNFNGGYGGYGGNYQRRNNGRRNQFYDTGDDSGNNDAYNGGYSNRSYNNTPKFTLGSNAQNRQQQQPQPSFNPQKQNDQYQDDSYEQGNNRKAKFVIGQNYKTQDSQPRSGITASRSYSNDRTTGPARASRAQPQPQKNLEFFSQQKKQPSVTEWRPSE